MKHVVEVDQNTKIEQSGATVLAFSNSISYAIVIPSSVKTMALRVLYGQGKSREIARLLLFAACVYLLLKDYLPILKKVIIDTEYVGREQGPFVRR